ncbi:DUF2057 family protein [Aliikangiella maris]|uniref:DUF2057 family protein n=2 Tax=Aliikangiella maris TaxID=3162458 RepID=A0ABV2BPS5_9GAMM
MPKKSLYFTLILTMLMPIMGLTAPELIIAESFNIKAINGTIHSSGFISQNRNLQLKPGKNLLVIEYEEVFDSDDNDSFDIVKSSPFLLTLYLDTDSHYQQKVVKLKNADAARRYIQRPLFEIVKFTKDNSIRIQFELTPLVSSSESYLVQQTQVRQNDPIDLSHPNPKPSKIPRSSQLLQPNNLSSGLNSKNQSMALQMLQYWWQQASEAERQQFIKDIKE